MNTDVLRAAYVEFETLAEIAYTSSNNEERAEAESRLNVYLDNSNEQSEDFLLEVLKQRSKKMTTVFCAAWGLERAIISNWMALEGQLSRAELEKYVFKAQRVLEQLWEIILTFPKTDDPIESGRIGFNQIIKCFAVVIKKGLCTDSQIFSPFLLNLSGELERLIQQDLTSLEVVLLTIIELTKEISEGRMNLSSCGLKFKDYSQLKANYEQAHLIVIVKFAIDNLPMSIRSASNTQHLRVVLLLCRVLETFVEWDFGRNRGSALSNEEWFQPTAPFKTLMIKSSPDDITIFDVVSQCYKEIRNATRLKGYAHDTVVCLRGIIYRLCRFKARKLLLTRRVVRTGSDGSEPPLNVTTCVSLPMINIISELLTTEQNLSQQPGVEPIDVEEELMVLTSASLSIVENTEIDIETFIEPIIQDLKTIYLPLIKYLMEVLSNDKLDIPSGPLLAALENTIKFWAVLLNRYLNLLELKNDYDSHRPTLDLLQSCVAELINYFIKYGLCSIDQEDTDEVMNGNGEDERAWSDKFGSLLDSLRALGQIARVNPIITCDVLVSEYQAYQNLVERNQITTEVMDKISIMVLFTKCFLIEYPHNDMNQRVFNQTLRVPFEFISFAKNAQEKLSHLIMGLVQLYSSLLDRFSSVKASLGVDEAVNATGLSSVVCESFLLSIGELSWTYLCQSIRYKNHFLELTEEPSSTQLLNQVVESIFKSLLINPSESSIVLAASEVLQYLANPARPTSVYLWMCPSLQEVATALGSLGMSSDNILNPLETEAHADALSNLAAACGATACSFESSRAYAKELESVARLSRSGTITAQEIIAQRQQDLLGALSPFVGELFNRVDQWSVETVDSRRSIRVGLWMNILAGLIDGSMLACRHSSFLDHEDKARVASAMGTIRATFIRWISQKGGAQQTTVPVVVAAHARQLIDSPCCAAFCHAIRLITAISKDVMYHAEPDFQQDCINACMHVLESVVQSFQKIIGTNRNDDIYESLRVFFKLIITLLKPIQGRQTIYNNAFDQWKIDYAIRTIDLCTPMIMKEGDSFKTVVAVSNGRLLHAYLEMVQLVIEDDEGRKKALKGDLSPEVLTKIMKLTDEACAACRTTQGKIRFVGFCVMTAIVVGLRETISENGLATDSVNEPPGRPSFTLGSWPFSAVEIGIGNTTIKLLTYVLKTQRIDLFELDQITGIICAALILFGLRTYCFNSFMRVIIQEFNISAVDKTFLKMMNSIQEKCRMLQSLDTSVPNESSPVAPGSRRDVEIMSFERDEFRDVFNIFVMEHKDSGGTVNNNSINRRGSTGVRDITIL